MLNEGTARYLLSLVPVFITTAVLGCSGLAEGAKLLAGKMASVRKNQIGVEKVDSY